MDESRTSRTGHGEVVIYYVVDIDLMLTICLLLVQVLENDNNRNNANI